ncbi:hypothetical protein ACMYYO_12095 [Dermacoccaceae bacterium W4C1]
MVQSEKNSQPQTPSDAVAQLSQTPSLVRTEDKVLRARSTAVLGVAMGVVTMIRHVVDAPWASVLITLPLFVIVIGLAIQADRVTRAIPRHSRTIALLGCGLSLAISLFAVAPWLNLAAQDGNDSAAKVLLGGLATAVPAVIAAAVVRWRR